MITFLFRGLLRDRHRSLFPVIIIAAGALLTTLLYCWMNGVINDAIDNSARFETGHVKIMTKAYAKHAEQIPNDLALTGVQALKSQLNASFPGYIWVSRIRFGGLLDIPDENKETRAQCPVAGIGISLLKNDGDEISRFHLKEALVSGALPSKFGEIVVSNELAKRMRLGLGAQVTLITSTAQGALSVRNFVISGTVNFGITAMDKGMILADIGDIEDALEMQDGAGEILGYNRQVFYDKTEASAICSIFNKAYSFGDQFSPQMITLGEQNGLEEYLNYAESAGFLIVLVFVITMSAVLWNAALMSGIRRYGEVGVRLAIGESKGHIYKTLLGESLLIGIAGAIIGTGIGLLAAWYFQEKGLDMSAAFRNSSMMITNVVRTRITGTSFYIGFIPGIFATLSGTAFAGIKVYRRQTASLFKELEA